MKSVVSSSFIRKLLELGFTLWATRIFQGLITGFALLFLFTFFNPFLENHLSKYANLNVPDWLFLMFGIAIVLAWFAISKKPLLRDANREQFEAIEYILKNLTPADKIRIYRKIANKICNQFQLDTETNIDLLKETKNILTEESDS